MPAPIGLQLYTIRDFLGKDYEGGVRKIADMGYVGVETAGFPGTTPEKAAKLFRELGLEVTSAHVGLPIGKDKQPILDLMNTIGSKRIISGLWADQFKTDDEIKKSCDKFNESSAVATANGMTFGIHNHWWEFLKVGDRYAYQIMLEYLDPNVFFELDVYWVQTAGLDPVAVTREFGARAPLLHIKDGPAVQKVPTTAVGDGKVDIPGIIEAAKPTAQWMIVELDACATDMMEAVQKSYTYLTTTKLARGRK